MGDVSENFNRSEFQCKCGCGFDAVDIELLGVLENLREHFCSPLNINSACRCKMRNALVGGSPRSQHLMAKAADVYIDHVDPRDVADYLEEKYPYKYGIGRYLNFTHIDVRPQKVRWRTGV